jgi:hypothetical protein
MSQRIISVLRDGLVKIIVLSISDIIFFSHPDGFDLVDNIPFPDLFRDLFGFFWLFLDIFVFIGDFNAIFVDLNDFERVFFVIDFNDLSNIFRKI